MTVHEIYTTLANRMIGAIMIHTQLTQIFTFVDLMGDARKQDNQLQQETYGYSELNKYYSHHHHNVLFADNPPKIDILDLNIFKKSNDELTPDDKVRIIQHGLREWIEWERKSKVIYEDAYHELIELSEVASAEFVMRYVRDVDNELKGAEMLYRVRDAVDWDLGVIYDKQARVGKR